MNQVPLADALRRATARELSAIEIIGLAETYKGSGDATPVVSLYEAFIANNADDPLLYAVLFNFGVILGDINDLPRARDVLERAIALNPDFQSAYINLGRIYERLGDAVKAVTQWMALTQRLNQLTGAAVTHKTMALNQTARLLEISHQEEITETTLRQSLELDPQQREPIQHLLAGRQRQCAWPVVQPFERNTRETQLRGISPLSICAYTDDPMFQLALCHRYNLQDVGAPLSPIITQHFSADMGRPDGRLRIGYLSSDLREHAVGYLMHEVLGLHDREKVEVFAYYCGIKSSDPTHEHYKQTADHFIDISDMDDATAARRIADDGIQILIDVNGYTRDARVKMLNLRPAPVIVNWLGFPGSMASPYHNYIIADPFIIPEDSEKYYSEKVVRLDCYQPTNRFRPVDAGVATRAGAGLPENGFVFCCFNGTQKITKFTFERWLEILKRVPDSVLWLLSAAESSHTRLKAYAEKNGIDPERIIFAAKLANPYHLARYPLADLFLDTTPYGAHTTCSDALWMGVPVLTYAGRSFPARVCGSLVTSAGLPELVCHTPEDFVDRAVHFGRNPTQVTALKERLKANRDTCVLFDTPRLVAGLERLYAGMWSDYKSGERPTPDLTQLETYLEVGLSIEHEVTEVQTVKDYEGMWREKLATRHAYRPLQYDNRLWKKP
jgi:predicted O-linked N-acetylglucosamine transferase (SPINDLY family)